MTEPCPHEESLAYRLNVEGWRVQFSASGERLTEMIAVYESIGLEIKTIPIEELGCDGCTICFESDEDDTMVILTRQKTRDAQG